MLQAILTIRRYHQPGFLPGREMSETVSMCMRCNARFDLCPNMKKKTLVYIFFFFFFGHRLSLRFVVAHPGAAAAQSQPETKLQMD